MRLLVPLLCCLIIAVQPAVSQITDADVRFHDLNPQSLSQGGDGTASAAVTNVTGDDLRDVRLVFHLSKNYGDARPNGPQVGEVVIENLPARETVRFTASIEIPGDLLPASYAICYEILPPGDGRYVYFSQPLNITESRDIDLKQRSASDQRIDPFETFYLPGESFLARTTITNSGSDPSYPFTIAWRLSLDEVLGNADDVLLQPSGPYAGISSGQTVVAAQQLILPK